MGSVDLQSVTKTYGATRALDEVTLTIAEGEFFGLLGPSGCGKTTLLRAIAGFVTPDSGRILMDGQPVERVPVNRRDIGLMFQNYALFPHLNVRENLGFGLSVRHRPKAEIAARVEELLRLVRLEGFGERKPRELSGGQQQRVALARALATNPRVLLLDEPLGALDKNLREEMQIELKQIQRELGITTIFVTHDQEEALTLSDRIAIMRAGRVEQIGAPRAIYERPATVFAANFLGAANLFTGMVEAREGGLTRVRLEDGSLVTTRDEAAPGRQVTLAVRPEKMQVAAPGEGPNRLSGTVSHEVFTGTAVILRMDFQGRAISVFAQNDGGPLPRAGEALTAAFDPANAVILTDPAG
ncbi:ABC transporter ATP-binding protein [Pseudogemmobacter humi]|uniref:Spermidine/putrescine import ATP-binding protein PotA n=1 Tax=Pseudogemmobacter humi TaxID=2483812 RepID=A0A3P5WF75_9RHOB|nr:ABC transporter ATP-binding protein [Pseudogemmobacter humi]VDC19935.1 Spermidine/putrescine import ATP-binding protein PotA [Pseudogemmobacter humi]